MINTDLISNLLSEILDPNIFIVEIRFISSIKKYIIYLDNNEGITLGQCEKIHRALFEKLIEKSEDFLLEVSSPGLTSNLIVWQQYAKLKDKDIDIVDEDGEKIIGKVLDADQNSVTVKLAKGEELNLKYEQIKKAKPVINFK